MLSSIYEQFHKTTETFRLLCKKADRHTDTRPMLYAFCYGHNQQNNVTVKHELLIHKYMLTLHYGTIQPSLIGSPILYSNLSI